MRKFFVVFLCVFTCFFIVSLFGFSTHAAEDKLAADATAFKTYMRAVGGAVPADLVTSSPREQLLRIMMHVGFADHNIVHQDPEGNATYGRSFNVLRYGGSDVVDQVSRLPKEEGICIADIGCGKGLNSVVLVQALLSEFAFEGTEPRKWPFSKPIQFHLTDINDIHREAVEALCQIVNAAVGDRFHFSFDSFDLMESRLRENYYHSIIFTHVLHYIPQTSWQGVMENLVGSLCLGGKLYMAVGSIKGCGADAFPGNTVSERLEEIHKKWAAEDGPLSEYPMSHVEFFEKGSEDRRAAAVVLPVKPSLFLEDAGDFSLSSYINPSQMVKSRFKYALQTMLEMYVHPFIGASGNQWFIFNQKDFKRILGHAITTEKIDAKSGQELLQMNEFFYAVDRIEGFEGTLKGKEGLIDSIWSEKLAMRFSSYLFTADSFDMVMRKLTEPMGVALSPWGRISSLGVPAVVVTKR